MSKSSGNKFFLISFIPALAYWYLESNYSLQVALVGGLGLAVIELALEYILFKHTHLISRLNFFLILILGVISLAGDDGIWFKLQPMFTGLIIGSFLLYRNLYNKSVMWEMVEEINPNPPPKFILEIMERHMSILLIVYGSFMGFVAWKLSTDYWVFFKTIGFYIVMGFFMLGEFLYLKKIIKQEMTKTSVHHKQSNQ